MHLSKRSLAERETTVFPLPFTPFEYYYYLDDRPEYPTTFPVELQFSGTMVREHFLAALGETIARHPLLAAVVDDSRRIPRWVAADRAEPQLDWADLSMPIVHPAGEYIDLRTCTGLRTWVRAGEGHARILFQFHHSCCDGVAAMQVLQDVLASYKIAAGEEGASGGLRRLDSESLRNRGALVSDEARPPSFARGLRDAWYTAKLWTWILRRSPTPLAVSRCETFDASRELLQMEIETLSREESAALRYQAASCGVTANDLLLRDLLVVMRRWNAQNGGEPKGRLRINVPVNVRTRDDACLPAANRIGFGFVTAEAGEADDPNRLLEIVRAQTRRIKEWKLGLYFLGGLHLGSRLPGAVRWTLARNKSLATAVLSNVGRFVPMPSAARDERWTCGDLVLERIVGAPPVRKLTRAAIIVIEYAGETTFCLRCDPHCFDARATRALLDAFAVQVRKTLRGET